MKRFRAMVGCLCLGLGQVAGATDLGIVLGLGGTEPCSSHFADDNRDAVLDCADATTSIRRPIVGVIETSFGAGRFSGTALSVTATFHSDLPTTATRSVRVPPSPCFFPPVTTDSPEALPPSTLDSGTTATLTIGEREFPLFQTEKGWTRSVDYDLDGPLPSPEAQPPILRFPGGEEIPALEIALQRLPDVSLLAPSLVRGRNAFQYWRFDLPLTLELGTTADVGQWVQVELGYGGTVGTRPTQYQGILPSLGSYGVPREILDAVDAQPTPASLRLTSRREHLVPITLGDGTPASVVVRTRSNSSSYSWNLSPIRFPEVKTLTLNGGATTTTQPNVAVRFIAECAPVQYQISLSHEIEETSWLPRDPAPGAVRPSIVEQVLPIPPVMGEYVVHVWVRNERGVSEPAIARIRYEE